MKVIRPNFEKRGLVTVIALDGITREVLMVAYANEAAWRRTLETGRACYYSTSRKKLWTKGEESGNFQEVVDIYVDCDGDALVYVVVQKGEGRACHTNARTCFYRSVLGRDLGILAPKAGEGEELQVVDAEVNEKFSRLMRLGPPSGGSYIVWSISLLEARLRERAKASPDESYTSKLLSKGVTYCAKKVAEEATEVAIAAASESDSRVISEAADLVYHLLVLLLARGLSFSDVENELLKREGVSGLTEKSSRATT